MSKLSLLGLARPRFAAPAIALAAACSLGSAASAATIPAPAASEYRDAVGVQMHMSFSGFAYGGTDPQRLADAINTLGIRHIRDHTCLADDVTCTEVRRRLIEVADRVGVPGAGGDLMLAVMPNVERTHVRAERDIEIRRALTAIRDTPLRRRIASMEMVNEPDLKIDSDELWSQQTIEDAKELHRLLALPEFASLRDIPILSPAMGRPQEQSVLLAAGWKPEFADIPNAHPYPPTHSAPERALQDDCEPEKTVLDCADLVVPGVAPVASESGYSTAGNALVADWVTPQAQAIYTPRVLLHNFQSGIKRTFLYELIDLEQPSIFRNHGYGLITSRRLSNGTMTMGHPKHVFTTIRRMHSVIGDLGAPRNPGTLDADLTDAATGEELPESQLRRLALQRADGTLVLALWRPEKSFKFENYKPSNLGVDGVVVDVQLDGSKGGWNAEVYEPLTQDGPIGTVAGRSKLTVEVDDKITLINLTPPPGLRKVYTPRQDPPPVDPTDPVVVPDPVVPDPVVPAPAAPSPPVTAPSTGAPRPGAGSQTTKPKGQLPARSRAAVAREKANRRARARARARRAYDACLRRQVAQAQRRTPKGSERPRPSRPTSQMRARCGRSPGR